LHNNNKTYFLDGPVSLISKQWNEDGIPLVSICSITYNHAPYIRQCLDGFLMQKTTFPVEILIHDDASTDGTEEIIREYKVKYPHIIKPLYEVENQWIKGRRGSAVFNFPRAQGKYIALCEGDDYWTDPFKLQKQVEFLENNPEYSICFHNVKIYTENENRLVSDYITRDVDETTDIYELAKGNFIHTPSVVFRNLIKEFPTEFKKSPVGDYFLHMLNAEHGKIKKLNDSMAVYRVHDNGVWSNKNNDKLILMYLDLMIHYFKDEKVVKILKTRKYSILKGYKLINRVKFKIKNIFNF
jgi:glycosyltransferase involved in cell wall biosynthesis